MDISLSKIVNQDIGFNLFDFLPSGLIIIDRDFRILHSNETFRGIFFKSKEELENIDFGEVISCSYAIEENKKCMISPLCDFCEFKRDILLAFDEKKDTLRKLFSRWFFVQDNKRQKHFQYTIKHIDYEGQQLALIIMLDLTELFVKSDQLHQAIKEKNELLGMAANDLRSPIVGARHYLDLLIRQGNEDNNQELVDSLSHVDQNLNAAQRIIDDTIDVTALELGTIDLTQVKQSYADFIHDNFSKNLSFAAKKDISMILDLQDEVEVFFDRARMNQVMDNLLSNAIKFSEPNTEIKVKVYRESSTLVTEVHDQGMGIAEDELPNIFEYFHRCKNAKADGLEETGLGLAIVKKIVRKHRGAVKVESKLGQGSIFTFSLPI